MVNRIVTIDKESNLVRLIHYTAQEYLDRNPISTPSSVQEKITKTCVSYLLLSDIAQGPCRDDSTMQKRFQSKPFLRYAACNWGIHARGEPELACREPILLLINDEEARTSTIQAAQVIIGSLGEGSNDSQIYRKDVSKLIFAASFGLTNIAKYFLTRDEDIEACDDYGTTALQSAATGGHTDTVEALLAAGADIDKRDDSRYTALAVAILKGHEDTAMALISKGASLQAEKFERTSPLRIAVRHGHTNIVNLLFEKGATIEDARVILEAAFYSQNVKLVERVLDQISRDQLQLVIKTSLLKYVTDKKNRSGAIVNLLLQRGADINRCNYVGESQLHIASRNGFRDIAELLLDHGIGPDIRASDGSTSLHWAAFQGHLPIVELLLERGASIDAQNGAGETALHTCLQYASDDDDTLSYLLKSGISLNKTDSQGRTSLHRAAQRGLPKAIISMIEKGADMHAKDHQGWMPLQHAAANGREHIFALLRDDHTKLQQPSHKSLLEGARLRVAIALKDIRVVEKLLCNHELDVNVSDYMGTTSLHLAASTGQINVVTALLNRGASVNARAVFVHRSTSKDRVVKNTFSRQMTTPLHLAAGNGYAEITEILLKYGAAMNEAGTRNCDVLNLALREGHAHIGQILLNHGAIIDRKRAKGRPPLIYWAIRNGYKDVVQLLLDNGANMDWISEAGMPDLICSSDDGSIEILGMINTHLSGKSQHKDKAQ